MTLSDIKINDFFSMYRYLKMTDINVKHVLKKIHKITTGSEV